jgi:hypothetical protein
MMTLGDFFAAAPHARPVNPRPVTLTCDARGAVLPGGAPNPHGRPVSATVTAAFVWLGGDGAAEARISARAALRRRHPETLDVDDTDLYFETLYHELWRVLFQWDPAEKRVGQRMFENVEQLRELVEAREARRVRKLYDDYVGEEHPEGVDQTTFRGAQEGGAGAPPRAPR